MKWTQIACLAVMMLAGAVPASAEISESGPLSSANGIPLTDVTAALSKKYKKNFILDPRAQTRLALSREPTQLSYDEFLDVLQVHGLVAVQRGDVVLVTPEAMARTLPVPLIGGNEKRPDAEVVTRIIHVRNVPAALLVPILRSLIPQFGHLAALKCTNDLLYVDRYANTKRLESIIQALDTGEPYKPEKCGEPGPAARD